MGLTTRFLMSVIFFVLIAASYAHAAPSEDDGRLEDALNQLKTLLKSNLADPKVIERCKNEAKDTKASKDPNMCIRRRFQECIFRASSMREESCEAGDPSTQKRRAEIVR